MEFWHIIKFKNSQVANLNSREIYSSRIISMNVYFNILTTSLYCAKAEGLLGSTESFKVGEGLKSIG